MKTPDCTLTTACFDLTSFNPDSRSLTDSINRMKNLLEVPCYLVIYADSNCMKIIKEIRGSVGLDHLTRYIQIELHEIPKYNLLEVIKTNREKYWPTRDSRTCAESHLITISKFDFVLNTIELNPFQTKKFGWIDANLGDNNLSKVCQNYKNNMLLNVLENLSDKFQIQVINVCDKKYKDAANKKEYYNQYRWVVCGCLFTMTAELGSKILNRLNEIAIETTLSGYGHGEEMLFLEVLDEFYDDIKRSYGDYHHILNNFNNQREGYHYVFHMVLKPYNNYGYHKECYDCCETLLKEIDKYDVELEYNNIVAIYFNYYLSAFYYKGKAEAREIINKLMALVAENPYIKKEFEKNEGYYREQFKYALE